MLDLQGGEVADEFLILVGDLGAARPAVPALAELTSR